MALSIEEKYDEVRQLITMGKEKGYLLYEEVNDMLPSELSSSDELDDIFSMFGSMGIEVVDSEQKYREKAEGEEGAELDLTPGALDKTNDPVRMYLREMGTVPLLTREGEVEIAKRIERGKNAMLRAIARTPLAALEVARYGERLGGREVNLRDVVVFNEEEITEEKLEAKIKETLKLIDKVAAAHRDYLAYRRQFLRLDRKSSRFYRAKWKLGRMRIRVSRTIRRIEFSEAVKRRLVERIRESVDRIHDAEDKIAKLEPKLRHKVSDEYKKLVRHQIREQKDVLRAIHDQARTIRIPVHMIETINKLIRTSRALVQELGREPTSEEIAKRMDIPVSKVRKVLKIAQEPISLETPIGEEEDSHLGDFIEDRQVVSPAEAVINLNLKEQTESVLKTLTPREEKVIKMRFGVGDGRAHARGGGSELRRDARADQ